jgi:cytochrome c oxidase assembly protein subunit 15
MSTQQAKHIPRKMLVLSFTSLALIYTIMLIGVYITSSHQGLSCPDWPLCPNGLGIPSPEHLFEHLHRMLVIITSGLIIATAIYAHINAKAVSTTAIIAAVIVIIQIFLGMIMIYSKLNALLVASHLATGILLFAMLLLTFISSYRERKSSLVN